MDTYQIKLNSTSQVIHLSVATQEDIEAVSSILTCDWLSFWSRLDPDCEATVKLEAEGNVQSLIHIQYGSDKLSETFFNELDAAIFRQSRMVILL